MKKLLLASLLTIFASVAYAGPSCGGCSGDKTKDDKKPKADSSLQVSSTLMAGSGCGDKDAKCGDKKGAEKSGFVTTTVLSA